MATVTLTSANFREHTDTGIAIIDFWAEWCPPCRTFAPVFERASESHKDIVFGKVDTDAERSLSAEFDVQSIPTIAVIRDGVIVFSQPGALPAQALESLISQVQALDMDEVRSNLGAETR